ncbi:unnamed protein product [Prorocentrum cordatum]|uniref:Coiled-coil domain-containing protein 153 n=1 Tax=Prorocentrum cordatum TaxID=2364126 RepID=A0ABN9U9Q8_9DINO|nr:unnamed protein product [Polarella glacialis]
MALETTDFEKSDTLAEGETAATQVAAAAAAADPDTLVAQLQPPIAVSDDSQPAEDAQQVPPPVDDADAAAGPEEKITQDELLHDTAYLTQEIDRVKEEKAKTQQDRLKLEEISRATTDRIRCDIRDGLAIKADLEASIYKTKRMQQEQQEENGRLRTYLSKCKDDLDKALR